MFHLDNINLNDAVDERQIFSTLRELLPMFHLSIIIIIEQSKDIRIVYNTLIL